MGFTLLGFPVRIDPSFWLVAGLLGLSRRSQPASLLVWVLVLLVSILVHELGHALTAARWSVVQRITVHGAGGETSFRPLDRPVWWRSVLITLAGPFAGFSLALLTWLVLPQVRGLGLAAVAAHDLLQVNVTWGLFNLLPIAPLDGGQALRAGLVALWRGRGEWVSAVIGVLAALVGLVAAALVGQTWAALVLGIFAIQNGQVLKRHHDEYRDTRTHTEWQRPSDTDR